MNINGIEVFGIPDSVIVRDRIYSIEEVHEAVKNDLFSDYIKCKRNIKRVEIDGEEVKANSQRLQLFFTKGMKCVVCGAEGKFFIMVKNKSKKGTPDPHYHLELIGKKPDGQYVLMTKDHIIPRSKGGENKLENYQTMCVICNNEKGDKMEDITPEQIAPNVVAPNIIYPSVEEVQKQISKEIEELTK
jgi:diadenosine tetraphosphate (Ap4A) HIT family hydrolase